MGFVYRGFTLTVLVLISIFFAPGLPPHFDFVHFSLPKPLELKGSLALNSILDKAQPIKLDSRISGPESIARRDSGEIYTGLRDGHLVKIKDGKVTNIGAFGDNCGKESRLACGRIAGLRFDAKGKLFLADVVNGIFKVDVGTGKSEQLVSMNEAIDGLPPRFPDDLDIDKDGNIYWSDASTVADLEDFVLEALAGPSGRLVKYNQKTGENTVLISKLHFANGVQLSANEEFVLVTETMGSRVWRSAEGKNQGQKDIFVDNLPGLPDNIRPNGRGGFYIVLASPRYPSEVTPLEVLGNWPLVRRFIVRLHHFLVKGLLQLEEFFPSVVLKEWTLWVKGFGPLGSLEQVPFKTIIVETDGTGKIIGSLQNDKGPMARLSEISVGDEWTYFGSPTSEKLYTMKTSDLQNV